MGSDVSRAAVVVLAALLVGPGLLRGVRAQQDDASPDTTPTAEARAVPRESLPGPDSLVGEAGMTPEELDALTARVAGQLRCPVCRNQSVLESSATLSQEMQAEIRRRLAAGDSPQEVRVYFVDRYGEWILLKPKAEGINLLVYLLPAAALLVGGLLVWRLLLTWSGASADARASESGGPEGPGSEPAFDEALEPEEEERLEAVLRGEGDAGGRG